MKAVICTKGSLGIETCRLACGGHGYLQASRLPELYTLKVAGITVEGESTVLLLQTARCVLCSLSYLFLGFELSTRKYNFQLILLSNSGGNTIFVELLASLF